MLLPPSQAVIYRTLMDHLRREMSYETLEAALTQGHAVLALVGAR